ncbi:UDP-N-acetylmuramate--L-alanine ligase [Streptomyces sp. NBC_01244]|uniref:UDP-N-acetylmuramate--L-alanine ligase n=1 Tax=Streptomyces sp. NBC_01244 TaxID=2903797 RepID=UPI002E13E9D3|nr:Mur ligase domain-containing protein [Streptomyces sp. NBC_01244]
MVETKHVPIPTVPDGPLDTSRPHFVGIGGAGMSSLALLLAQRGSTVTGSDVRSTTVTDRLQAAGATISIGHTGALPGSPSLVIWSSALGTDNTEVAAANRASLPVVHRSQLLAHLVAEVKDSVIVAGTHGKSTTTAMLASAVGVHLSGWSGGGDMIATGANAGTGPGDIFVAEGDESDRSLTAYRPEVAVILTVDDDHPETYVDRDDAISVYAEFARNANALVFSVDDEGARHVAELVDGQTLAVAYGRSANADVRVTGIRPDGTGSLITLRGPDGVETTLGIAVPGDAAAMNAVAAYTTGLVLGIDPGTLITGLATFAGVARRMTPVGDADGVTVMDSFAHHPTAVTADIGAARQLSAGGRVVVVFEPSGWTRTAALGESIGRALAEADEVVLLPVHSLLDSPIGKVGTEKVAAAVAEHGTPVHAVPDITAAGEVCGELVRPGDLVLTMGTGAVAEVGEALLAHTVSAVRS